MCMVEGRPYNLASMFAWSMTRPLMENLGIVVCILPGWQRIKGLLLTTRWRGCTRMRQMMEIGQRRLEDGMQVLMEHFPLQPPPSLQSSYEEELDDE
ncbi:hypothetical protein Hanom_Chr06g00523861 [Helianthus anomalus]